MCLSKQARPIAGGGNGLHPIGPIRIERASNVPINASSMGVKPRCKTDPARDALSRICKCAGKQPTPCRKLVQVRRARVTANAADRIGSKLVGHDEQDIWSHGLLRGCP